MLLRAAEEMLSPFGYDMERLDKVLKGMDTAQAELEWPLRARGIEGRGPLHAA
jgi:hypothetical protein